MPEEKKKESARSGMVAAAGQYTGYGLTWALSTLLFLLAGWWLDGKLGTMPLFLILGAFVGGGAGFYNLYSHIVGDSRSGEEDVEP